MSPKDGFCAITHFRGPALSAYSLHTLTPRFDPVFQPYTSPFTTFLKKTVPNLFFFSVAPYSFFCFVFFPLGRFYPRLTAVVASRQRFG